MRWFAMSIAMISASTSWPFWTTSEGWAMRRVHAMSETCTSPSTPGLELDEGAEVGEVADNALDLAADAVAGGEVLPRVGLRLAQRQRQPALLDVGLGDDDLDLLCRPGAGSCGFLTFLVHDISETWIRPSTPSSSSTNAP